MHRWLCAQPHARRRKRQLPPIAPVTALMEIRSIRFGLSCTHVIPLKWIGTGFLDFLGFLAVVSIQVTPEQR